MTLFSIQTVFLERRDWTSSPSVASMVVVLWLEPGAGEPEFDVDSIQRRLECQVSFGSRFCVFLLLKLDWSFSEGSWIPVRSVADL